MKIKTLFVFSLFLVINPVFSNDFDIHGRDMTFPSSPRNIINPVGHVGIEYNSKVYNMLPSVSSIKTMYGQYNYLHLRDVSKYTTDSKNYWGAKYENLTDTSSLIDYLNSSKNIGVDYTYFSILSSDPSIYYDKKTKKYLPKRGVHRCDTFVISGLSEGGVDYGVFAFAQPWYVFNSLSNTR